MLQKIKNKCYVAKDKNKCYVAKDSILKCLQFYFSRNP